MGGTLPAASLSIVGVQPREFSASSGSVWGGCRALNCFGPNINIVRDPRWGRASETYGEDPHLTGELATAFVTGLQGNDSRYLKASTSCR